MTNMDKMAMCLDGETIGRRGMVVNKVESSISMHGAEGIQENATLLPFPDLQRQGENQV